MRIDETFRRAAGLFVEMPPEEPKPTKPWNVMDAVAPDAPAAPAPAPIQKTVEQVVRESPGPNLDEIKPIANPTTPIIDPSGAVNFTAIYELAKLPSSPFSAEQVIDLLATLPSDLPIETKRSTVKITVNAMSKATGVTTESIVADASRKLAALAAYAKSYSEQATTFTTKAEAEIAALLAEIEQRKRSIEDARTKQTQMVQACTHESDRLDEVLEFFSLDVSPSKYAGQ